MRGLTNRNTHVLACVAVLGGAGLGGLAAGWSAGTNAKAERAVKDKGILNLSQLLFSDNRYQGKTVLICWHHGTIPDLARALGATNSPDHWKSKVFDRVWQISYDDKGNTTFADRPQRLLPDDSRK